MQFKKIEKDGLECTTSALRPFGCMELWAGNERAHRSLELAGLEGDVIAVPSGGDEGGDLAAVFSCSDNVARVVRADCVGQGDVAGEGGGLRLTTLVTGTYDGMSGEFNSAYAAHPRMLVWRARKERFCELGEGLENLPLGFITGEQYSEQSIRLNVGDMIVAFSDGATEAQSPAGEQLAHTGFLSLAEETLRGMREPASLAEFSQALLGGVQAYRGGAELEDDVTLLTLRRVS